MQQAGRDSIGELADRLDDAVPARCAVRVAGGCELVGSSGAFLLSRGAIPPQHQVGGTPDLNLRHHDEEAKPGLPINS